MIHVVFNVADEAVLKQAMEMDPDVQGEVFIVRDDYAVGPIEMLMSSEGQRMRSQWWNETVMGSAGVDQVDVPEVDDVETVKAMSHRLEQDESESIWIWAAQNQHDVCGYFWLISQLSSYTGRVQILYLNNLPFINEKGQIFYPNWLHQIPAREFIKAKKLARPVTGSEFELDRDEWMRICASNAGVRILEGSKKLVGHGFDYFDSELARHVTTEPQKAGKIIHGFLSKTKDKTGDLFLLWRLKEMLAAEKFDYTGELRGLKDFEVKRKTAAAVGEQIGE
ncbi:MAG: DUF1835 domain-containing protein [Bacteroidota bacterium]